MVLAKAKWVSSAGAIKLLIWDTDLPQLTAFATTKADKKNNSSRIPPQSTAKFIEFEE